MSGGNQTWQRLVQLLGQLRDLKTEELEHRDRALAAEVAAQPGVLEARLETIDALAALPAPTKEYPSLLGAFWNLGPPGDPLAKQHPTIFRSLPATLAALDPSTMVRAYAATRRHADKLGHFALNNGVRLGTYFLSRTGIAALDALDLVPEHRDVLRARLQATPLPDVLPADLTAWSAEQIERTITDYAGVSLAELEKRLHPGGWSASGFLAPGESLGEVIRRDAITLATLGVSRHDVADRIGLAIDLKWRAKLGSDATPQGIRREARLRAKLGPPGADGSYPFPLTCDLTIFMGYQSDPFHSVDTSGLHPSDSVGSADFMISNPGRGVGAVLRGPNLITALIRRFGFFEGAVPYRVDPARAAWVLGLTETRPTR